MYDPLALDLTVMMAFIEKDEAAKHDCCTQIRKNQLLQVETDLAVYEIEFGQLQIEVTGKCNMSCLHCRASNEAWQHMPINEIVNIIRFIRRYSPDYKEIVISGGEPLLYPQFAEMLTAVRNNGGSFVTITTNGSLVTQKIIDLIACLKFDRFIFSVSLDSLEAAEHDAFRRYDGAFDRAIEAIKLIVKNNIQNVMTSIRTTVKPENIANMEAMVKFGGVLGVQRVSFSAIHPAGRATLCPELLMTREQKRSFIEEMYRLKALYPGILVSTNDPIKRLARGFHDRAKEGELVFDGCGAGAITFNVGVDGTMTPCALLNIPLMNVFGKTIDEISEIYRNHPFVKQMLDMELHGKCGECELKYQCGGCRVRALYETGDVFGEDPHCWK